MTDITLADKIAALEAAIVEWRGYEAYAKALWRMRALEAVLADLRAMQKMSMQASEIKDAAAAWAEDVVNSAERRGAEEMRERAAKEAESYMHPTNAIVGRMIAAAIRALPVEQQ